jgi:hypothetical protein
MRHNNIYQKTDALYFATKKHIMQQELAVKIHEAKYRELMPLQDYLTKLTHGLQLIRTSGIFAKDLNSSKAINLALEYNMELMVNFLSVQRTA